MIKRKKGTTSDKKWVVLTLFIFLLFSITAASANEILDDVSFEEKGGVVKLTATLALPFEYVKHFPSRRGKIIQIQIKVDKKAADEKKLKRRETIKPPDTAALEIRDVIYEGNVRGGPYLVLRFSKVVNFTVEKSSSPNKIVLLIKKEAPPSERPRPAPAPTEDDQKMQEADQIMRDARAALTNGQNSEAILLFTKLLDMEGHKYKMDAKEYLGLSRERNGQLEIAKKEYEEYLQLYEKEPRANTVRQRLMTLNARMTAPKKDLKEGKRQQDLRQLKGADRTDIFGRFSQIFYSAYIGKEPDMYSNLENKQSVLLTFADATWRKRTESTETRMVFSGSDQTDFLEGVDFEQRVRSLYVEHKDRGRGFEVSFGRQTENSGGVLGRFDGGVVGFRIKPKVNGYLVGGWPVDFLDHTSVQSKLLGGKTDKPMAGARIDVDEVMPHWKGSVYGIYQGVDTIVNRSAVGADARYFFEKKIFYGLVDYDVGYNELNFLTAHYGWQANEKTKIDLHFDRRKSPVMLTSNALIGITSIAENDLGKVLPGMDSNAYKALKSNPSLLTIKYLLDNGVDPEVLRQRAKANTGNSTLITASVRRTIDQDLEVNGNLTLSSYRPGANLEDDDDDVPEDTSFLPSKFDYTIYGQVIQRNWFKPRDIVIGGLRLADNDSATRFEVNGTVRVPTHEKWWISVKGRIMYTTNKRESKNAVRMSPKAGAEYRHTKSLTLEGELGTEVNKSEIEGEDYTWTNINLGFRYVF